MSRDRGPNAAVLAPRNAPLPPCTAKGPPRGRPLWPLSGITPECRSCTAEDIGAVAPAGEWRGRVEARRWMHSITR